MALDLFIDNSKCVRVSSCPQLGTGLLSCLFIIRPITFILFIVHYYHLVWICSGPHTVKLDWKSKECAFACVVATVNKLTVT